MSAIAFSVEYYVGGQQDPGLRRLAVAFERAGAELAQPAKHIFPLVVPVLEAAMRRQFDAEGAGPDSGKWAPLSARYKAWKDVNFPGLPILERYGRLRAGLTMPASPFSRRDIDAQTLVFGTREVPYATFHQTGTDRMPARPPIDLDRQAEVELRRAALAGVRDAIREATEGEVEVTGE